MKLIRLFYFMLVITLFTNTICAQNSNRIRIIVFAATDDATIGKGNQVSLKLLKETFERVETNTDNFFDINFVEYPGNKFSLIDYEEMLAQLKTYDLTEDVLLFYFMGHGFMSEINVSPNLLFYNTSGPIDASILEENSKNLAEIHDELKQLGAKLTISMAEACNTRIDKMNDAGVEGKVIKEADIEILPPELAEPDRYKDLFQAPKGDIMVFSSLQGRYSFVSQVDGGIFTQGFCRALDMLVASPKTINWDQILTYTKRNTVRICGSADLKEKQIPSALMQLELDDIELSIDEPELEKKIGFLKKLFRVFKGSKEPGNVLAKVARGREPPYKVYQTLIQPDVAETYISNEPFSYYLILGKLSEKNAGTQDVFLNYSIAKRLYDAKPPKLSTQDGIIVGKLEKLSERSEAEMAKEIRKAGSVYLWLNGKHKDYKKALNDEIKGLQKEINDLYDLMAKIEDQIVIEQDKILNINQEIETLKNKKKVNLKRINELKIKRVANLKFSIPDIASVSIDDLDKVQKYVDCIRISGGVEDCQSDEITKILANKITVEFEMDPSVTTGKITPDIRKFNVGEYCNDKIIQITERTIAILMEALQIIPRDSVTMSEVKIKGTITGFADFRGAGKKLGIYYQPKEYINTSYINKYNESIQVKFSNGKRFNITNEQLAFLRAYCAYQIIKAKIEAFSSGLIDLSKKSQFDIDFKAIEQDAFEKIGDDQFRGVEIQIEIENLFKFIKKEIKNLSGANLDLDIQLNQKQNLIDQAQKAIDQLKMETKGIQVKIDERFKKEEEIEGYIDRYDLYGDVTEANIKKVK